MGWGEACGRVNKLHPACVMPAGLQNTAMGFCKWEFASSIAQGSAVKQRCQAFASSTGLKHFPSLPTSIYFYKIVFPFWGGGRKKKGRKVSPENPQEAVGEGEGRQQVSGKGWEAGQDKGSHNTGIQALPPSAPPHTLV